MKLSNKKIKYIKRHALKKTPEEIAKDLRVSYRDVQSVLKQIEDESRNDGISTHRFRKDSGAACTYHLIAFLVIVFLGIIIYSNTLNSPFVFDDGPNIKENRFIRITNFDFKKLYDAGFKGPSLKRPVAKISFALNYYWGKYAVAGYHIVNIIIHLVNGILVYLLALIIFKQANHVQNQKISPFNSTSIPLMALFAALIFVVHPIQTQSVTYIVQRMNSLAAMFYLLSLFLYIQGRLTGKKWQQWVLFSGCFASWMMALGSKEIAATLPLVILIYEWYFFQDLRLEWLRRNIKFCLGLLAVLCLVVFLYLGQNPFDRILADYSARDFTLSERVMTQFRVIVFYIGLLLFPHPARLNLHHHVITSTSLIEPLTTLFSLVTLLGLIGLAVYFAKRQRLISFGILWFFIHLVIESSVIGLEMIFEHRLYLPLFGVALIVSYLLFALASKRRWGAITISVIIVIALSPATYLRNSVWRDELTLWQDCVAKSPNQARPHNNLGNALAKLGRTDAAIDHYLKALQIEPDYVKAHNNLGNAMAKQGHTAEAIDHFLRALQINPDFEKAHNNLGNTLAKEGRISEAIDQFIQALRIMPDYEEAHINLGNAFLMESRTKEAIDHYLQALRLNPDSEEAHNNLGNALARQGRPAAAIDHFLQALQIKPDYLDAHYNLGNTLASQGRLAEAIDHFLQVLRIKPDNEKVHNKLGIALAREGRIAEAIVHFRKALQINPNDIHAKNNLEKALMIQQQIK